MTNSIETKVMGAIRKACQQTDCNLFASDIRLNSKAEKYFTVCKAGECLPLVYESEEVAAAFMGHICRIAKDGQDFPYQPQMRISESLKGSKILVYPKCNSLFKPTDNVTLSVLPIGTGIEEMGEHSIISTICEQASEIGARVVMIENATPIVGESPRQALALLDTLAQLQEIMIFAGFKITQETEAINNYLFNYSHNLCTLQESCIEISTEEGQKIQPFFCVEYGHPATKFVVYGIDEQGNTFIPAKVAQMLMMNAFGEMFARKPVKKALLLNQIYGALEGQFSKKSVTNMIGLAVEAGILNQSGADNKATISLAGTETKKKPAYSGTIAISAKGNAYSETTAHTKKRKPLCRIGEFKLLAPAEGCSVNPVKNLTTEFIKAVATGKPALDFAVKTGHRNTLVIMLAVPGAAEWMQKNIGSFAKDATFDVVCISDTITDGDFLATYRQQINSLQPDFCFILNFDRVKQDIYTPAQLAKEVGITSKSKGVTTIAQTANDTAESLFEFEGNEFWCVKPLVNEYDMKCIAEMGVTLPSIYSFEAVEGKFEFLCRFKDRQNTSPSLTLATSKEQKRAFLIATFYFCNRTPYSDIGEDCTGRPLTNSVIYQAQKEGLIRVDYTSGKKYYRESLITFIGKWL